jgi:hypothetical protein
MSANRTDVAAGVAALAKFIAGPELPAAVAEQIVLSVVAAFLSSPSQEIIDSSVRRYGDLEGEVGVAWLAEEVLKAVGQDVAETCSSLKQSGEHRLRSV